MVEQTRQRVAVYFVASPLNYLAARRVALDHEAGARQVLVCYRPALKPMVRDADWDAVIHMPWPRFDPLPGLFGRLRRTVANIRLVAGEIGRCETIHLHSPVFDTEAVNYFVRALPRLTGAGELRARILPDGVNSLHRHPMRVARRLAMQLRRLRGLVSPLLRYAAFSGDRIGSEADFVDRIYVLSGFSHEYDVARAVVLGPLVEPALNASHASAAPRRALVLGQPLLGHRQISESQRQAIKQAMARWLEAEGIERVDYKPHPREHGDGEFWSTRYSRLVIDEPLESYMAHEAYDVVMGVCSTALFTARQIQSPACQVVAVGAEAVRFDTPEMREDLMNMMRQLGIVMVPVTHHRPG
jgi:hypothetical protein